MRGLAFALFALASCGGASNTGGSDDAADFVGNYTNAGTTTYSGCPVVPAPVSGSNTSTAALGPAGEITTSLDGCSLNWTVSGGVATLVAGQSCSGSLTVAGKTVSYTAAWTSGTLTLVGDTATLDATGNATFVDANGTETCTFTQNGMGTKG